MREFNASVTRSLNEILCAVENLQTNPAAIDGRLAQLERSIAARKMELDWLYRWTPVNKLARRLFYGRNLRKRITAILGFGS